MIEKLKELNKLKKIKNLDKIVFVIDVFLIIFMFALDYYLPTVSLMPFELLMSILLFDRDITIVYVLKNKDILFFRETCICAFIVIKAILLLIFIFTQHYRFLLYMIMLSILTEISFSKVIKETYKVDYSKMGLHFSFMTILFKNIIHFIEI